MSLSSEPSAASRTRLLLLSRDYIGAEQAARQADSVTGERPRLLRMCFARQGRFSEAAVAGREVLQTNGDLEDHFRLPQILLRLGEQREAFACALVALVARPTEARYVVPAVEAVLLDPALMADLEAGLAKIGGADTDASVKGFSPIINLPVDLPHYVEGLNGRHPWVMGLVESATPDVLIDCTVNRIADLPAAIRAGLPRARACMEQLIRIHPIVDRGTAAAYVAHRFLSCLYETAGPVDLLPFLPFSLAERPFVVLFDFLGNLFSPFVPFEDMNISSRNSALYWIVRASLESELCRGIVTNYAEVGPLLGGFFGSPKIERKSIFINPAHLPDAVRDSARSEDLRPRGQDETITLLFTSSVCWADENFYYRGGVDVLNAFIDLSIDNPRARLVLRSQLPSNLSARLRQAVETHPGIRWLPDRIPWDEYRALLAEADIFVMPSVLMYRNGLVQTMTWGIVPVVGDCLHASEMIKDGVTGIVTRGRGHRGTVMAADQRLITDWSDLLRATDQPADPTFYERYRGALSSLLRRPEMIRRMSENIIAASNRHDFTVKDRNSFATLMQRVLTEVPNLSATPEVAFPIQPHQRPGDPVQIR